MDLTVPIAFAGGALSGFSFATLILPEIRRRMARSPHVSHSAPLLQSDPDLFEDTQVHEVSAVELQHCERTPAPRGSRVA